MLWFDLMIARMNVTKMLTYVPVISTFILALLGLSGVNLPTEFNFVRLLVFSLSPGYYLTMRLRRTLRLTFNEIIILDCVASFGISTILTVCSSLVFTEITNLLISCGIFLVTVVTFFLYSPKQSPLIFLNEHWKESLSIVICFLIGAFFTLRVLPESYWRGWDPWYNTPITRLILHDGITPFEITSMYGEVTALSGFYYFIAAVNSYTGIDLYSISRYGGVFLSGFSCVLIYLIIQKLEGGKAGLAGCLLFSLNPIFLKRFSMMLRENFAFIFLLAVLYFFLDDDIREVKKQLNGSFIIVNALFLGIIVSSHSLTPVFSYGLAALNLGYRLLTKRLVLFKELLYSIILSVIVASMYVGSSLSYFFSRAITHWMPSNTILFLSLLSLIAVTILVVFIKKRYQDIFRNKRNVFPNLMGILLVGALYAILFPKTFALLGAYQPPIGINDFAIVVLPLALIGFSVTFLQYGISKQFLFLSSLLLAMLNLPNVNIAFPQFRLLIYGLIILSYGAAKGFKVFCNSGVSSNLHVRVPSLMTCLVFILILTPFVAIDVAAQRPSLAYFTQRDVDSATTFMSLLQDSDIIIPQSTTHHLLRYVGVDENRIYLPRSNFTINKDIYEISDIDVFIEHVLSEYPNVHRILIFIIEKKLGDPRHYSPSILMLESSFDKQRIGTILIYAFNII
jgi:hypothetical protein